MKNQKSYVIISSQLNNLEQILCRYRRETYKPQKREADFECQHIFRERLQAYYLRRAMTDSGDNDTSVQNARPAGNPAEVRFL